MFLGRRNASLYGYTARDWSYATKLHVMLMAEVTQMFPKPGNYLQLET